MIMTFCLPEQNIGDIDDGSVLAGSIHCDMYTFRHGLQCIMRM